jgi:hypothetical protein
MARLFIPELLISPGCAPCPGMFRGRTAVRVWYDEFRAPYGHGYSQGDRHWMKMREVGIFQFAVSQRHVSVVPAAEVSEARVREVYRRCVLPMALQVMGVEVLHASAVLTPSGVVAFCASSTTGKSTLVYALSKRQYPIWADDAVALSQIDGHTATVRLPFTLRLREDACSFFQVQRPEGLHEPADLAESFARLHSIYVLRRSPHPIQIEELSAAQALPELLGHAYCFNPVDLLRKRSMVKHYLDCVASVPVYRLSFRPSLQHLDDIIDALKIPSLQAQAPRRVKCQ